MIPLVEKTWKVICNYITSVQVSYWYLSCNKQKFGTRVTWKYYIVLKFNALQECIEFQLETKSVRGGYRHCASSPPPNYRNNLQNICTLHCIWSSILLKMPMRVNDACFIQNWASFCIKSIQGHAKRV